MPDPKLTPAQDVLYRHLQRCRGDVAIDVLFDIVCPHLDGGALSNREKQQRIGRYIAPINAKIAPAERIMIGISRRSYRLAKLYGKQAAAG